MFTQFTYVRLFTHNVTMISCFDWSTVFNCTLIFKFTGYNQAFKGKRKFDQGRTDLFVLYIFWGYFIKSKT